MDIELIDTLRQTATNQLARHGVTIQRLNESSDGKWYAVLRQQFNEDGCYQQGGTPRFDSPIDLLVRIAETAQSLEDNADMNIFTTELFPYISGEMIRDKRVTMTIKLVKEEELKSSRGSDLKPVMYFKERDKGLILNKTNAKAVAAAFGPETRDWHGRQVVVYGEYGTWFGNSGWALRLEPVKTAPVSGPEPEEATERVNGDLFGETEPANAGAYAE